MASVELLLENFGFIGIENIHEAIIVKCQCLCAQYHLNEEALVDEWIAFTMSSRVKLDLTVSNLAMMERKRLANIDVKPFEDVQMEPPTEGPTAKVLKLMDADSQSQSQVTQDVSTQGNSQDASETFDKTQASVCVKQPALSTLSSDLKTYIHPAYLSDTYVVYDERQNRGNVLNAYKSNELIYPKCDSYQVNINIVVPAISPGEKQKCLYMYDKMIDISFYSAYTTTRIAEDIAKLAGIDLPEQYEESTPANILYGRIISDGGGSLNINSILLNLPAGDYARGEIFNLKFSPSKPCNLFPGQVVVVQGNAYKNDFWAETINTIAHPGVPQEITLKESLYVIAAAGPFTPNNNLNYHPLRDLMRVVLKQKPHVLILMGPFLDEDNEELFNDEDLSDHVFSQSFISLIESVMTPLKATNTKVILVPSYKDIHHRAVYPTLFYKIKEDFDNLILATDPALIDIEGVLFGATTADVLLHLAEKEFCRPTIQKNAMERLVRYVTNQKQFYPLYPVPDEVPVDFGLLYKLGGFETVPHVLLLPSNFKAFVTKIGHCIAINPERLTRLKEGGAYVKILVEKDVTNFEVSCEIIEI